MADTTTVAAPRASLAEDFIDIFYAPSSVFERRRTSSPWPAILVVSALFIVASYISFTLLGPVIDAEMQRQMARAAADNPSIPAEQMATMQKFGRISMMVGFAFFAPLAVLLLGLALWVVGKVVGAQQTLAAAFLVIAYSFMPRVLEAILGALQAFVLDVNTLPSMFSASLTPARFADPETSQAVLALLSRLGPFVIWSYVLIAIGLRITGRVSGQKAAIAAVVLWVVATLAQVVPAMLRGG
jgi:hypothetical protein